MPRFFSSLLHTSACGCRLWIWIWALLVLATSAQLDNYTSPTHQFKSRPDLHAPIIHFDILRPELVTPGYIFLAPYRNLDPGPYIYDNYGNLVWSGAGSSGPKTAHTPRVCKYKGKDHLCYFQGEQHQGFARGHGVILDQSYRIVKTIESAGAGASNDMHEFRMTPYSDSTTVLMTIYQPRQYDLTTNPRFNIQNGMGWVVEGVFQEVDIETGSVVFEWRSLDHVDPSEAWTLPASTDTSGDGLHEQSPWDYFHINSIDKNEEGDYLISARHVSAVYKLSGETGEILWQLGGNNPSFDQVNFQFSYQHHARWISENSTHTVLSLYDNAGNSFNATGEFSHGWIIAIDHMADKAYKIKEWGAPELEGGLLSTSQGNMQLLPNGGCHIGWGEHAYFSEHTASGEAVMYGKLAERASNVMIYRSNKYNWTAQPVTKPALWAYSRTGEDTTGFWVSWNGATEVRSWNLYIGNSASGPWKYSGNVQKSGFETEAYLSQGVEWSFTEAVDGKGRALERSAIVRTFVPSEKLRPWCDDRGCGLAEPVAEEEAVDYEAENEVEEGYLSTERGYNTVRYYADFRGHHGLLGGDSSTVAVGFGLVLGCLAALGGFCVWRAGGWRRASGRVWEMKRSVAESEFVEKVLGRRYRRLKQRDYGDGEEVGEMRSSSGG